MGGKKVRHCRLMASQAEGAATAPPFWSARRLHLNWNNFYSEWRFLSIFTAYYRRPLRQQRAPSLTKQTRLETLDVTRLNTETLTRSGLGVQDGCEREILTFASLWHQHRSSCSPLRRQEGAAQFTKVCEEGSFCSRGGFFCILRGRFIYSHIAVSLKPLHGIARLPVYNY